MTRILEAALLGLMLGVTVGLWVSPAIVRRWHALGRVISDALTYDGPGHKPPGPRW